MTVLQDADHLSYESEISLFHAVGIFLRIDHRESCVRRLAEKDNPDPREHPV